MEKAPIDKKSFFFAKGRDFWIPFLYFILIVSLPFTYYLELAIKYKTIFFILDPMQETNISEISLIGTAIVSSFGLISFRKFGWFLFVIPIALLIHNILYFIQNLNNNNIASFLHTVFVLYAILLFLQRDIFFSYLYRNWRGVRYAKRYLVNIKVQVQDTEVKTINISTGGMLLDWSNCNAKIHQIIDISFELNGEKFECKAEIVNKLNEKIGIAFKGIDKEKMKKLKEGIKATI